VIAEILSTGDEIRTGAVLDTNAAYIAEKLELAGVYVQRHQSVGDDIKTIASVLKQIGRRADLAVVTGGLGPTADDVTAEAAALATGSKLALRQDALDLVQAYFLKRGRPFTEANRKQAMLPELARMLPNPIGTAPGFVTDIGGCRCYFLPGVPAEMRIMLDEQILPEVSDLVGDAGDCPAQASSISSFGLPEAGVAETLGGFQRRFPLVKLGLRAVFPEILIRLYPGEKRSKDVCNQLTAATDWVANRLGKAFLSESGRSMPDVVGSLLRDRKATLAVAESCTGGLIAHLLTGVAGSSDYFLFSAVTYANQSKIDVLGVEKKTLRNHGAVHEETARQMAAGARRVANADYGLSTTGIAGPSGGTPQKPVGTVCIGLADRQGSAAQRFHLNFENRRMNKRIFAFAALEQLRQTLLVR
jgi:nicotinamide-nucleotide amidase